MINELRQTLPIYSTTAFTAIEKQQRFRAVCSGQTGAPRIVASRLPEFVLKRAFSVDTVTSIVAHDVTTGVDSAELYNATLVSEWQDSDNNIHTAFLGAPTVSIPITLECGHWYYYKITIGTSLYYSDIWAAADYSGTVPTAGNMEIHITPNCTVSGIPFDQLGGFQYYLTLHTDLVTSEQSESREEEEDEDFNVTVVSQTITKRHVGRIVDCPQPLLDFLYMAPLFLNRSTFVARLSGSSDTYTVTDFQVSEVETSLNPCAPLVSFQIRLESDVSESCCETNACNLTAPVAPTMTGISSGVVRMVGAIDANQFANIFYKLSANPTYTQFGANYTQAEIAAGVIMNISPGTYDFKYSKNTFGCSIDSPEDTNFVLT